jgi:hypothetical protein
MGTYGAYGYSAIEVSFSTNVTISGNTIGPNIPGAGIGVLTGTNNVVSDNTINSGWTGVTAFNDIDTTITRNRILNVDGTHACGIIAFDANTKTGQHQTQNVSITNNLFKNDVTSDAGLNGDCGVAFEGDPQVSLPMPIPQNFTIAYNVFFNSTPDIADWGKSNTANVYGNILLTIEPASDPSIHPAGTLSLHANYFNNIVSQFSYLAPGVPSNDETFSNNVAISSNKNIPPAGNNSYNPALGPVVTQALSTPGQLPSSICNIINKTGSTVRIGLDYFCQ